jgi:hypothetical protein
MATTLYRVLPWLAGAAPGEPGHALFIPGIAVGRIDNPDRYLALYLSDAAGGACAEAFFYKASWDVGMLRGQPALPGSVLALATYSLDGPLPICDLDDGAQLLERGLRPSQVVTRDRTVTRAWALQIFDEARWAGIRWWSYHDPGWASYGIWAVDDLVVQDVQALTLDHAAIIEAAGVCLISLMNGTIVPSMRPTCSPSRTAPPAPSPGMNNRPSCSTL